MSDDDLGDYFGAIMRARPGEYGAGPEEIVQALLRRPRWHSQAACRGQGTGLFFPERGDDTRAAKAICDTCTVAAPCGAAAGEAGIWAGMSPRERMRGRRAA